jgi:O-antigen/teichoic acid export membrane protein
LAKNSKQIVGEGAAHIFIQVITSLITGYLFWIILSKISTPEVIGTFSVIVSFADIIAYVAMIGLPEGAKRFLGKSFSQQKIQEAKVFVKASVLLLCIGILVCSAIVFIARYWVYDIFKIDLNSIIVALLVIGTSSIYILLNSIVISSFKTKVLPKITIIYSAARIALASTLVLMGGGAIGLTLGYTVFGQLLGSILLGIVIMKLFRASSSSFEVSTKKPQVSLSCASKNILIASAASWIPLLVPTIGSDLGTLVLFGSQGSNQAGVYFITFTIYTGILSVTYSLITIGLPALSGMEDGRKRFTWQIIRLSAVISVPLSTTLIFYSKQIMQLIGQDYSQGSLSLQVLLLSMLPMSVINGIDTLVFSYGSYRQSLAIGLAMNIPRAVLYFILVPIYGSTGAATSYTVGSVVGFIMSIMIAKRIKMQVHWKSLAFILIIPAALGFALSRFEINYIVAIITSIIASYLLLLKLQIITKSDVKDSIGILPYQISNPTNRLLNRLDKGLSRFYR